MAVKREDKGEEEGTSERIREGKQEERAAGERGEP